MPSPWTLIEPSVPAALRSHVLHVRVFDNEDTTPFSVKVAPVALPGVVLHHKGRCPAIASLETPHGTVSRLPPAFIYGAGTTPSTMRYHGGPHLTIQIILKPQGLRSILGLHARRLRNGFLPLSAFSGAPSFSALLAERTPQAKTDRLLTFLARQALQNGIHDRVVERALDLVEQQVDDLRLAPILRALGISERQLERRFSVSVGVPPKTYLRVRRFNQALRLMKSRRYSTLASIAYALNFADQSHFIRDLKAFAQVTPKGLSQRSQQFHEQAGFSFLA